MRRLASMWLAAAMVAFAASSAQAPADSIYQLDVSLTTQDGRAATLDMNSGHPTVISMFYSSCPNVCPTLIASIRRMEQQLTEPGRGRLRVLLVSLDPERDSPAQLKELAQRQRVDSTRWTFATAGEADVRKLAAVLGVRYRKLPDGEFNHSTVISLLDPSGRITHQTSKLSVLDADFLQKLRVATGGSEVEPVGPR